MRAWSLIRLYTILVYVFMFAPIAVVMLLAFNSSQFGGFPIEGFSLRWPHSHWCATSSAARISSPRS